MFEHITSPYHHLHHFRPPIMKSILLAASNEAKAKTSDKSGDIVAQLPLGRHEEGVKEGPRAIPDNDNDDAGGGVISLCLTANATFLTTTNGKRS